MAAFAYGNTIVELFFVIDELLIDYDLELIDDIESTFYHYMNDKNRIRINSRALFIEYSNDCTALIDKIEQEMSLINNAELNADVNAIISTINTMLKMANN